MIEHSNYLEYGNVRGLLVVISGPAGSGKSTLANRLITDSGGDICRVVTTTTRLLRPGEADGVDYNFITPEIFRDKLYKNEFVEYNIFNRNYYGTPRFGLERYLAEKKIVVLVVDVNGAKAVQHQYPSCLRLFILPPTPELLRERLTERGTENAKDLEARLQIAENEISRMETYDYLIVNDNLPHAVADASTVIHAARAHRISGGESSAWRNGIYANWHSTYME